MTTHELQDVVRKAWDTVQAMDDRTRRLALNSGVLDRMFESASGIAAPQPNATGEQSVSLAH